MSNSFLWLYRTLRTPITKANTSAIAEDTVRIWPITPTLHPKVNPMSIRSRPTTFRGGVMFSLENVRDGIIRRLLGRSLADAVASAIGCLQSSIELVSYLIFTGYACHSIGLFTEYHNAIRWNDD